MNGGASTFGYAYQNPISYVDPYGLACFDFHQFADEIEENRLDLLATLGALVATEAVGTMPKTPSEMRALGIPKSQINPYTSQLSRWSSRLDIRALREAGRTTAGMVAGTAATGALVFEGFYDWGVIGMAAWNATSLDDDCDCD